MPVKLQKDPELVRVIEAGGSVVLGDGRTVTAIDDLPEVEFVEIDVAAVESAYERMKADYLDLLQGVDRLEARVTTLETALKATKPQKPETEKKG